MKRNQESSVVRAQDLNFILHGNMPSLVPVCIRECTGFIVGRREYPTDKGSSHGCRLRQMCSLRQLWTKGHGMLMSCRTRWRRTWTCKLLERIFMYIIIICIRDQVIIIITEILKHVWMCGMWIKKQITVDLHSGFSCLFQDHFDVSVGLESLGKTYHKLGQGWRNRPRDNELAQWLFTSWIGLPNFLFP